MLERIKFPNIYRYLFAVLLLFIVLLKYQEIKK